MPSNKIGLLELSLELDPSRTGWWAVAFDGVTKVSVSAKSKVKASAAPENERELLVGTFAQN